MKKSIYFLNETKYKVEYEEGSEWTYRVFRYDEDVTDMVRNNFVDLVLIQLITLLEKENHND